MKERSNIMDHNHFNNVHYVSAHRRIFNDETKDEIVKQTLLGVPVGRIRSNLGLDCGSGILYEARREALHDTKMENLNDLVENLKSNFGKDVKMRMNEQNKLASITIVDKEIVSSDYAKDIIIMDDTATTNKYGI